MININNRFFSLRISKDEFHFECGAVTFCVILVVATFLFCR